MKINLTYFMISCLGLMLTAGCQKTEQLENVKQDVQSFSVVNGGNVVGEMEVSHDGDNLYIHFDAAAPDMLNYALFVGDCESMRRDTSSLPNTPDFSWGGTMVRDTATAVLSLSSKPRCLCISTRITSTGNNMETNSEELTSNTAASSEIIRYCR